MKQGMRVVKKLSRLFLEKKENETRHVSGEKTKQIVSRKKRRMKQGMRVVKKTKQIVTRKKENGTGHESGEKN